MPASLDQEYEASNSEIVTFRRCRRRWWLHYLLHLAPQVQPVTGPLPLGSRVHKSLERYYKGQKGLLEAHQELVEEDRFDLSMLGADTADLDTDAELGRIMLEGYLEWVATEGLDDGLEVIGIEEILRYPMPMPNGQVTLIGKLDLRVLKRNENQRLELDFKTAATFNHFNQVGHMLPQLKTYQLLDMLTGDKSQRIEGGIYRLLKKVKRTMRATPPFYQDITIRHNLFTLRSFWFQLIGVLRDMIEARTAILSGKGDPMVYAYPNQTNDCRWSCPFFTICPMFDDGSDVESAITDQYIEENPYERYTDPKEEAA